MEYFEDDEMRGHEREEIHNDADPEHLRWRAQVANDAATIQRLMDEKRFDEMADYINSLPD